MTFGLPALLIATGFGGLVLAWRGVAASDAVSLQLPFLISGGLGGIALIGLGLGLLEIQISRQARAAERDYLDRLTAATAARRADRQSDS